MIDSCPTEGGAIRPGDCHGGDGYSAYRVKGHIGVTPFDPECLKETAEELCEHYHVKLLYHMLFVSCESDNGRISKAFFATKNGKAVLVRKTVYCFSTNSSV